MHAAGAGSMCLRTAPCWQLERHIAACLFANVIIPASSPPLFGRSWGFRAVTTNEFLRARWDFAVNEAGLRAGDVSACSLLCWGRVGSVVAHGCGHPPALAARCNEQCTRRCSGTLHA